MNITSLFSFTSGLVLLAAAAVAQDAAAPPPIIPAAPSAPVLQAPAPANPEAATPPLRAADAPAAAAAGAPQGLPTTGASSLRDAGATGTSRPPAGGIVLNFQGASLGDVLNYLSEAAGFVIVQEAPVTGTVNIVSRQPLNADEAVDLVNTVLVEKGYLAIRNGRILKIVSRANAQKRDLPVVMGSDPAAIPRKDDMVTQILPLRFGEAAKVIENLRPLLAETASMSANESSNAIILTDTQTNIHRVAEIIRALDTSVSSISGITVFPLKFADSKAVAATLTQLFASSTTTTQQQGSDRGRRGGFGGFPGFPGMGGGGASAGGSSEARAANARVLAVADEQSNSVIVSAPDEVIPTIRQIINQIDTSIQDVTDTKIFRLQHADAVEMAGILNSLYADTGTTGTGGQQTRRGGRGGGNQQQGGGGFPWFGGGQQTQGSAQSERALQQSRVVAVGDPRTNSLLVTAAQETMTQIAEMIGRLDATEAKKQRVFVHRLKDADAESVAAVLRGMLGEQSAVQTGTNRLIERSASGATLDTTELGNQGLGGGGGRAR